MGIGCGGDKACAVQEDIFIPTLTLRETLWLSTCLRMPAGVSHDERHAAMLEGLRCMGLTKVTDSQVGLLPT